MAWRNGESWRNGGMALAAKHGAQMAWRHQRNMWRKDLGMAASVIMKRGNNIEESIARQYR